MSSPPLGNAAAAYLQGLLAALGARFEVGSNDAAYVTGDFALPPIAERAATPEEWEAHLRFVAAHSHDPRHSGWMAHMNGTPSAIGVQASAFVDALGNNMIFPEQAPAAYAARLELEKWISSLLGWRERGHLAAYESGSLANLHAMVEARNHALATGRFADRRELLERGVVLCSAMAHQSVAKAVDVVGLPASNLVPIATDGEGRLSIRALQRTRQEIAERGKRPFLLLLTLGTTSLGAVDPIAEAVAAIDGGAWVHVDGAFGGGLVFARRHRLGTEGFGGVHSLSLNPHKLPNMPCGQALLLFRRPPEHFSRPLPYAARRGELRPSAEWMLSGSGRPTLLAFYLSLLATGVAALAEHVDAHMDRTLEFARGVERLGFEVLARPGTPVVVFRRPDESDGTMAEAARDLERRGLYLSTTRFRDQEWLRAVLINSRIDLDRALEILESSY